MTDFEPKAVFRRIDRSNLKSISSLDLKQFLKENSINYSEECLKEFFITNDKDNGLSLKYNE